MTRRPPARADLPRLRLWWYGAALPPVLGLVAAPLLGRAPLLLLPVGLFLLFFWIFSLGFAIYARLRKPPVLRQ